MHCAHTPDDAIGKHECRVRAVLDSGLLAVLHLRLGQVNRNVAQRAAGRTLGTPERREIAAVVFLDDLKGPFAVDDVASDHQVGNGIGDLRVPGVAQRLDGRARAGRGRRDRPGRGRRRGDPAAGDGADGG